jgi:DNA-binding LacI/PurR family transcriptional regulator
MLEARSARPRIADVAREAGVSKTAVSFAFNSPERLNPETARRIHRVADALGYRPHPVARMLSQRRTRALGVLTPQALSVVLPNPFFGAFMEGVALATEDNGYALHLISPVHGSLARGLGGAIVDGVVAIGLSATHPEVEAIERIGLPIVLVDSPSLETHAAVDVDDEGGARAAAAHVVGLGHRSILIVGVESIRAGIDDDPASVPNRRLRGYRGVLTAAGIELRDDAYVVGPATIEGGRMAFHAAWSGGLRPTAVLAMSDAMAIGAMRAVQELGLRVPRDISVVGFDDIELAAHTDPPLTTVHQPIRQKGEEAARLLLSLVDGTARGVLEHRRLETRLVVRASTDRPAGRGR